MARITAQQVNEMINSAILFAVETQEDDAAETKCDNELINDEKVSGVVDFRDVGMLSGNAGLVIRMADGSEFQIQVVQSQLADDLDEDDVDEEELDEDDE